MPIPNKDRELIKRKATPVVDAVKRDLSKDHSQVAEHIFRMAKDAIQNMDCLFVRDYGRFGPDRRAIRRMCEKGIIKDEYIELCGKL